MAKTRRQNQTGATNAPNILLEQQDTQPQPHPRVQQQWNNVMSLQKMA